MDFSFQEWVDSAGRLHSADEPAKGPAFQVPETGFKNYQPNPDRGIRRRAAREAMVAAKNLRASKLASLSRDEWVRKSLHSAFSDAKKRARLRGVRFDLEWDQVETHLKVVGPCCSLTGIPFRRVDGVFRQPFRPSFDRIDAKGHYTPKNVRIVACCVNAAMNEWGVEILDTIARGRCVRLDSEDSIGSLHSVADIL